MDIQRLSKKLIETLTPEELIAIENGEVTLDGNRVDSYTREPREKTIIDKRVYTPKKKVKKDFHFVAAWEVLTQSTFELGEAIATEDDPKMYFYDRKLVLAVDNDFLDLGRIKASEWREVEKGFVSSSLSESAYIFSETKDSFTLTFNTVIDQNGWVHLNYYSDIAKFTLTTTFDSYEGILGTAFYNYRAWLASPTDTALGGRLSTNDPNIDYNSSSELSLNGIVESSHNMSTIKGSEEQVTRTYQVYPYYRYLTVENRSGTVQSITGNQWTPRGGLSATYLFSYNNNTTHAYKIDGMPSPSLGDTSLVRIDQYGLDNPGRPWDQYTASISVVGDVQDGSIQWVHSTTDSNFSLDTMTYEAYLEARFIGQAANIIVTWTTGKVDTVFRQGRFFHEVKQVKLISLNGLVRRRFVGYETDFFGNIIRPLFDGLEIKDGNGAWEERGVNPQLVITNETVAYTTTKSDYTANISETELTDQEYTEDSIILSLTNTNKVTSIVKGKDVKLVNYRYIEIDPKVEDSKCENDEMFVAFGSDWAHWFKVYEKSGNKKYVYLIGFRGTKSTIAERRIYAKETTIDEDNNEKYRYAQYLSSYNKDNPYKKDIEETISSLGWVTGQINPTNFAGVEKSLSYNYGSLNRLGGSWTHIDKKGWIAWFRVREGLHRGDRSTKQYEFLIGFTGKNNKVKKRKIYAIEIDKDNNAQYAAFEDENTISIDSAIASLSFANTIQITDFWTNPTSYNLSFSQSPNEIYEANTNKPISSAQEIVKGRLITPLSGKTLFNIEKIKPKGLWEGFYPTIEEDYILTYKNKGVWSQLQSYEKGDTVKRKEDSETKYRTYIATKSMAPTEQEPTVPDPLTSSDWVLIYDDRLNPLSPAKYKLISDTIGYF